MPTFIHLANLILDKKIIDKKYHGGCNQFRIDWNINNCEYNQEDDELFSISAMNIDEFDIEKLLQQGLEFNQELNYSNDFAIISRYGGALWQPDWLNYNSTFAWHSNCNQDQKDRAKEIPEIYTFDKVRELFDKGINVFETIKTTSTDSI